MKENTLYEAFKNKQIELQQELNNLDQEADKNILIDNQKTKVSDLFNDKDFTNYLEKRNNLTINIKKFRELTETRKKAA